MIKEIEIGPRNMAEIKLSAMFSLGMTQIAAGMGVPQHVFADVICASIAGLAEMNGSDPAARLQALDAYHEVAKKHLMTLMTQGQVPQ